MLKIKNQTSLQNTKKEKTKVALASSLGVAIPLILMMKKQKVRNPFKLNYNLKDTFILSASSIACATAAGVKNGNKNIKKHKIKEGAFQFLNTSFCSLGALGLLKFSEKFKPLNNNKSKLLCTTAGIVSGMVLALKLTNKLFKHDDLDERKLKAKDFISSSDDILSALAVAKVPVANSLHLNNLLPIIYSYCGYRAGSAEINR